MKAKKTMKPRAKKTGDGRQEYQREWRAENRLGTFEKKIKELVHSAKGRARELGLEFSIKAENFIPITHCPLLGIKLNFASVGRGYHGDSPSIDRLDPTKGYVPGNVWVISNRANRMKSDATIEEIKMLAENLSRIWEENQ